MSLLLLIIPGTTISLMSLFPLYDQRTPSLSYKTIQRSSFISLVQAICPLQKQHHKVLGATSFVDRTHPQFALNAITQLRFTQKGNLHKASVTDSATVSVFTEPPTKTSEALTLLKFPKEAGNCVRLSRGICTSGSA